MTFLAPIFAFGMLPMIELFTSINEDDNGPYPSFWYDLIILSHIPIQYFLLFKFLNIFSSQFAILSSFEMVGMIVSMGISCGILGINTAHELGHRSSFYEKWGAYSLLISSLYLQFYIDHNKGHHKFVATPNDTSTAKYGEWVYFFIPKAMVRTFLSAMRIDPTQMILFIIVQILYLLGIYYFFGINSLLAFLGAALIGISLLETVNYIEHYGLTRKLNPNGKFEKTTVMHSWNSNFPLGRYILIELSRHSDHHSFVNRKYQDLKPCKNAPHMPLGYPAMMLLAAIPPLWFKIMNPKVKAIH